MIFFYRLLFPAAFLFAFPYYLLRMLRRGGYARDFSHRLGGISPVGKKSPGVCRIWIQAVSVGEVNAVAPLLKKLAERDDVEVVLTTTTSTGYAIAREKLAGIVRATGIFPIDFWLFSRRAWKRIAPDVVVLMEGELWPEHLHRAVKSGVPVLLLNARLSDRSFRRYSKIKTLARRLLGKIDRIGTGTAGDAERFAALGVPAEKITVTGNLKFDVGGNVSGDDSGKPALLRELGLSEAIAGKEPLVLLGSSTWPGEETMLLDVLRRARAQDIPLKLLLVPRHAERREEIFSLLEKTEFRWFARSKHGVAPFPADICLADTTGELSRLTGVADFAFIGKSLPPNDGGQSPIDCAAHGVAQIYGPAMTNFRDICKGLENAGAARRVEDSSKAIAALLETAKNAGIRETLGENARAWHTANRGATERTAALLEKFTGKTGA